MARRKSTTPLSFWTDMAMSGIATAVTLSVRLPQIASGTMSAKESTRMVNEKGAAVGEGFVAGSAAAARITAKRLMRPAPHRAFNDALDIVEAASRPARRRVKANAKRLSRAGG